MAGAEPHYPTFSPAFRKAYQSFKRKKPELVRAFRDHFRKVMTHPELGKPLRHSLRNFRRIHIESSFVVVYEIKGREIHFLDFDHHDRIYKKYS